MSPLPPITTIFMFESPVLPTAGAQKRLLALLGRKQCRHTLFFHQEHDELRRFAVARVAADDVNVIRAFIESFAGLAQICFSFKSLTKRRSATAGGAELCWT